MLNNAVNVLSNKQFKRITLAIYVILSECFMWFQSCLLRSVVSSTVIIWSTVRLHQVRNVFRLQWNVPWVRVKADCQYISWHVQQSLCLLVYYWLLLLLLTSQFMLLHSTIWLLHELYEMVLLHCMSFNRTGISHFIKIQFLYADDLNREALYFTHAQESSARFIVMLYVMLLFH